MDVTRLRAEPGGQAQISVKVKNPGHLVEAFHMDVVGLDPTWWQVHPPELNIYPGKEESAVVILKPPANAQAPDEALPFGIRAVSALDAQRTVVEEGDLEVGRVLDLQGSITPVTSKGRWSGRHQISYRELGQLTRPPAPHGQGRRGGAGLPDGARAALGSGRRFGVGAAAGPPAQPVPARRGRAPAVPGDRRVGGVGAGRRYAALGDGSGRRPRPGPAGARRRDPARADPVQGRDRARRPPGGRDRRSGRRGVEGRQRGGRPHPAGGARAADPTRRGSRLRQRDPAAVGAQRPCGALPGPEGRQHEHRAGHRRGEGRGDGLHLEGRRRARPRCASRSSRSVPGSPRVPATSSARRRSTARSPRPPPCRWRRPPAATSSRGPTTPRTIMRSWPTTRSSVR